MVNPVNGRLITFIPCRGFASHTRSWLVNIQNDTMIFSRDDSILLLSFTGKLLIKKIMIINILFILSILKHVRLFSLQYPLIIRG